MERKSLSNNTESSLSGETKTRRVHPPSKFKDLTTYDLTNPDYKIHDLLPTLELIYRRFSQLFRHSLTAVFRRPVDIHFESVDSLAIGDYLHQENIPDVQYIYRSTTLKCAGFMALETPLLYSLVDIFFSGTGEFNENHQEELTNAEIRIMERLLKSAADDQTEAWSSILSFKIRLAENHNRPISTVFRSDTEIILLSRFTISLGSTESPFHIIMPYQALEPVREKLQAFKFTEQDPTWQRNMMAGVMQAPLEVSARLCELKLSLRDVLRLKTGQIIQADIPSSVTVKLAGIPAYRADVCTVNNMLAMKILDSLYLDQKE
ncbi:flagellar motor switch protein FliM [Endozoicomonas sp. 2B-B]